MKTKLSNKILDPCKTFIIDFIHLGILGWCLEILYTSFQSFRKRNWKLTGQTSLWMFPIYGCGALLRPLSAAIRRKHIVIRGLIYAIGIFSVEFVTGLALMARHACPWDYKNSRYNVCRVIRLDYTPFWFLVGLLFEKTFTKKDSPNE